MSENDSLWGLCCMAKNKKAPKQPSNGLVVQPKKFNPNQASVPEDNKFKHGKYDLNLNSKESHSKDTSAQNRRNDFKFNQNLKSQEHSNMGDTFQSIEGEPVRAPLIQKGAVIPQQSSHTNHQISSSSNHEPVSNAKGYKKADQDKSQTSTKQIILSSINSRQSWPG